MLWEIDLEFGVCVYSSLWKFEVFRGEVYDECNIQYDQFWICFRNVECIGNENF